MRGALKGMGVVLTRAEEEGGGWMKGRIEEEGGEVLEMPVLEIFPGDAAAVARAVRELNQLEKGGVVAFVSGHAVRGVGRVMREEGLAIGLFVLVAAVGEKTARVCEEVGIGVDVVPRGQFGSEGLVAELERRGVDFRGRRVVIFRAQGGREWLREALEMRGARVEYVEAYLRVRRVVGELPIATFFEWCGAGRVDVVLVGSVGVAEALVAAVGEEGRGMLGGVGVVAYSERVAEGCRGLGLGTGAGGEIRVAEVASDEGAMEVLLGWNLG